MTDEPTDQPTQLTTAQLSTLTPEAINSARRAGQLDNVLRGIGTDHSDTTND